MESIIKHAGKIATLLCALLLMSIALRDHDVISVKTFVFVGMLIITLVAAIYGMQMGAHVVRRAVVKDIGQILSPVEMAHVAVSVNVPEGAIGDDMTMLVNGVEWIRKPVGDDDIFPPIPERKWAALGEEIEHARIQHGLPLQEMVDRVHTYCLNMSGIQTFGMVRNNYIAIEMGESDVTPAMWEAIASSLAYPNGTALRTLIEKDLAEFHGRQR